MPTTPINDTTPRVQYISAGQSVFDYGFWIGEAAHLAVYKNGILQTLNTDYTLAGVEQDSGGTVTFTGATLSGDVITLVRSTTQQRLQGYTDPAGITARALNKELGLYLCMIQELTLTLARTLQLPLTATDTVSAALPVPVAGKYLGWNGDATQLVNLDGTTGGGGSGLPNFTGNAREIVRVNPAETDVEYLPASSARLELLQSVVAVVGSIDTATDIITTVAAHGLTTGKRVKLRANETEGASQPGGTAIDAVYFARAVATNQLSLHNSGTDANSNLNKVNLTSVGSGRIEVLADPSSQKEGDLYTADGLKHYCNGALVPITDPVVGLVRPRQYQCTAKPVYVGPTTFSVAHIDCKDSTQAVDIVKTTSTTVDITTTGLGGILRGATASGTVAITNGSAVVTGTGTNFTVQYQPGDVITVGGSITAVVQSVASSTSLTATANFSSTASGQSHQNGGRAAGAWYYLYAVSDGKTTNLVLSTRSVANGQTLINLPAGYLYRQLPFACLLDSSGNLVNWVIGPGWPVNPLILFKNFEDAVFYGVLAAGAATSFTTVSCAGLVPKISQLALLHTILAHGGSTGEGFLRITGSAGTIGTIVGRVYAATGIDYGTYVMPLNSSQQVDYKVNNSATLSLQVMGFVATEVV